MLWLKFPFQDRTPGPYPCSLMSHLEEVLSYFFNRMVVSGVPSWLTGNAEGNRTELLRNFCGDNLLPERQSATSTPSPAFHLPERADKHRTSCLPLHKTPWEVNTHLSQRQTHPGKTSHTYTVRTCTAAATSTDRVQLNRWVKNKPWKYTHKSNCSDSTHFCWMMKWPKIIWKHWNSVNQFVLWFAWKSFMLHQFQWMTQKIIAILIWNYICMRLCK